MLKLRPTTIRLGDRDDTVLFVRASRDAIYCHTPRKQTTKLAATSLEITWRVESDRGALSGLVGEDFIVYSSPAGSDVRATGDGRLLWSVAAKYAFGRDNLVEVQFANLIELRDPATGAIQQSVQFAIELQSAAIKCGDSWVASSSVGLVTGLGPTGNTIWQRPLCSEMEQPGAQDGSDSKYVLVVAATPTVFVARSWVHLCGCDASDGAIRWSAPVVVPYHWPNIDAGRVIVLHDNRFVVIELDTGKVLLDRVVGELPSVGGCKPGIIRDQRIAFPHESGELAVIDIATGELVQLYKGKKPLWSGAVNADGRLLIGTGDGHLLVFDETVWG